MLIRAAKEHAISLPGSVMIGDKLSDLRAAFAAGCRHAALVLTGHGSEQTPEPLEHDYPIADNILDATEKLLMLTGGKTV